MFTPVKNISCTEIDSVDFMPLYLQRIGQALKKRGTRPLQKKKRTLQFISGLNLFDFLASSMKPLSSPKETWDCKTSDFKPSCLPGSVRLHLSPFDMTCTGTAPAPATDGQGAGCFH